MSYPDTAAETGAATSAAAIDAPTTFVVVKTVAAEEAAAAVSAAAVSGQNKAFCFHAAVLVLWGSFLTETLHTKASVIMCLDFIDVDRISLQLLCVDFFEVQTGSMLIAGSSRAVES